MKTEITDQIDISKLNKAEVLSALYNNSRPIGMGFLQYREGNMETEEAQQLLDQGKYFDYLKGRVMKIDMSGDVLCTGLYDRDNGQGAAYRAIKHLL